MAISPQNVEQNAILNVYFKTIWFQDIIETNGRLWSVFMVDLWVTYMCFI